MKHTNTLVLHPSHNKVSAQFESCEVASLGRITLLVFPHCSLGEVNPLAVVLLTLLKKGLKMIKSSIKNQLVLPYLLC